MNADGRQGGQLLQPYRTGPDAPAVEGVRADLEQLRWLRVAAVAEATTLLLLVAVAVPLKHYGGWPLAVRVLGPIHGLVFVAYLWLILQSLGAGLVSRGVAARLCLSAFVPLTGYVAARLLPGGPARPDRGAGR